MRKSSDFLLFLHEDSTIVQKTRFHIILCCITLTLLASCSVKKYVPEGKYFLSKNEVVITDKNVEFTKSDLSSYITQKPYKIGLLYRFPTWLYYVTEHHTDKGFWRWVNKNLTKTPEYFDKEAVHNSVKNLEQYLDNRGYFHSKVTSQVLPYKKCKRQSYRLKTVYTVYPSQPYRIKKIQYQFEDTLLEQSVMRIKHLFPAKEDDIYNSYVLDEQRTVITNFLRNTGYYYFTKDYISYEVDSNFMDHTLNVTMKISNYKDRNTNTYHPHKKYIINKINIYPNYMPSLAFVPPTDSATITFRTGFRNMPNTLNFYYHEKPRLKPNTFKEFIQIRQGGPYRQRQVELTYSALSSLKVIANTSIEFDTVNVPHDSLNYLNCNIYLRRSDTHSLKLQMEGTNSEGDLGISGSITYTNKNIFKGAEVLQVSLKGGLEAQSLMDIGDLEEGGGIFNTRELNLNANLIIPKFLSPVPMRTFSMDYQPKTAISLGGSVQERFIYSRYMIISSFGYDWKTNPRLQFVLTPIYINYVKVDPIPEFQAVLDQQTNQRLKDQYTSHFLVGGRYSFIYNTQNINKSSNYIYLKGNLESSGGLLSLFNKTKLIQNNDDCYQFLGIRYAQYVRGDIDFRQYWRFGDETWLVTRQMIGVGIPYGNSYDMPFERSFYAGGSTGMRGWSYRKLGPGAYNDPNGYDIERIGDIQLEMNTEFRFPVYGSFKGAVFVDAGNIWNYHPNEQLPGGEFKFNTFYQQIALDGGLGVRLDLKMVMVRFDLALPLRNPYPDDAGNHWTFNKLRFTDLHGSFNIGYPF